MDRILGKRLVNLFQKFPAVFLTGPRQSGKTTLAKMMFPDLPYVNFEDTYLRDAVKSDPNGFLEQYDSGVIIDEAQNIPEFFPFLQIFIDKRDKPGQYLITGSQNFLLNEKISQSLAGRVAVLSLLPLSYSEIHQEYPDIPIRQMIFSGGYPRMYKHQIESQDFFPSYIQTYVERDVRSLKNIEHLSEFRKLLFLCAGRVGQILNLQSLCNDIGISIPTIKSWISLLETSYILYLLRPFSVNTGKQMVKSPKIYFYDTGLLCGLLGIRNEMELRQHYAYGSIFENFVINEILKSQLNKGERENIYFLRDSRGHEIDCLVPHLNHRQLFEIKSSSTFNKDFVKNLEYFKNEEDEIAVIYQGETNFKFKGAEIMNCERFINMMNFLVNLEKIVSGKMFDKSQIFPYIRRISTSKLRVDSRDGIDRTISFHINPNEDLQDCLGELETKIIEGCSEKVDADILLKELEEGVIFEKSYNSPKNLTLDDVKNLLSQLNCEFGKVICLTSTGVNFLLNQETKDLLLNSGVKSVLVDRALHLLREKKTLPEGIMLFMNSDQLTIEYINVVLSETRDPASSSCTIRYICPYDIIIKSKNAVLMNFAQV